MTLNLHINVHKHGAVNMHYKNLQTTTYKVCMLDPSHAWTAAVKWVRTISKLSPPEIQLDKYCFIISVSSSDKKVGS